MRFVTEQISDADAVVIAALVSQHARPGMVVVELGTYTGRSALAMLPILARVGKDAHLFCVDWFRGNVGVEAEIGPSYRENDILGILRKNIEESGYSDLVTVLVGTTTDTANSFDADGVDVLFVDADHRYSAIKADLDAWLPKVRRGGLIFGHDFEAHLNECDLARVAEHCEKDFVDGRHYGVIRAVCERFPDVHRDGRIWWAIKGAS